MTSTYRTIEEYPIALSAEEVGCILGISRSNAYKLMRAKGFPTLHIGKRMLVPKDRLIRWIEANVHTESCA